MKLRRKIAVFAGSTVACLTVFIYAACRFLLTDPFVTLDKEYAQVTVQHVRDEFLVQLENLGRTAAEQVFANHRYRIMADAEPAGMAAELLETPLSPVHPELVLIVDESGDVEFDWALDAQRREECPVPPEVLECCAGRGLQEGGGRPCGGMNGILLAEQGPLVMASRPLTVGKKDGKGNRCLIVGHYLEPEDIRRTVLAAHIPVTVHAVHEPSNSFPVGSASAPAFQGMQAEVEPRTHRNAGGYTLVRDLRGRSVFLLEMELPRALYREGRGKEGMFLVTLLGGALAFCLALLAFFERVVVSRIARLKKDLSAMEMEGSYALLSPHPREDELSFLEGHIAGVSKYLEHAREEAGNLRGELEVRVRDRTRELERAREALRKTCGELELRVGVQTCELEQCKACLEGEMKRRRQAEEALRIEEATFRHIYELSPVMMHSIDENGFICNVNRTWLEMTGYSREEVIGRKADFLMTPESAERAFSAVIPRFWRDGRVRNIPYQYVRRDGGIMDVLLDCDAVTDPTGRRISLSVVRDVTREQRVLNDMWKSKVMLKTVVDGIQDILVMMDQDLIVKMLNEAALNYYGLSGYQEAVGKPCYEAFRQSPTPCEGCPVSAIVLKGEYSTYERRSIRVPDRFEQVVIYPVGMNSGGLKGSIIRISDITDRKKVEEQLIRANRLSSLGQLSGGIAHEIRNPLTGISLFLDILCNPEKFDRTDQEMKILNEIKENVQRITGIIRRVLDFAKHANTESREVSVNSLITDTLKLWHSKMRSTGIRLKLSLSDALPPVKGDPIEIQQVLNNLIQNAVEAMPSGGDLELSTCVRTSALNYGREVVMVVIRDSGPGIPMDFKERVFDPFFTTKPTGTGLGLSISHQIAKRHGGILYFESNPQEGSVFTLELPLPAEE